MRAHRSFRHEALLYRDSWEFLDAVVPFIADGLAKKQPVMVAVIASRIQAIRAALGDSASQVFFVDMSELGLNPARIIPGWQRFIDTHGGGGQPLRGVGEPIWAGRTEDEIVECQLHEGLLNLAIPPDTPLWLMCPYDVHALDASVAREARHSHPALLEGGRYTGSTSYSGAYYVEGLFARGLPAAPPAAETHVFTKNELGDVVNRVLDTAFRAGVSIDRAGQLAMAVREIADDATAGNGGPATLTLWSDADGVVCEVRDPSVTTNPIVGRVEAVTRAARKGLWQANQVCDLIQVRSNDSGTSVRVRTWTRSTDQPVRSNNFRTGLVSNF